jgi:hypothetical protein
MLFCAFHTRRGLGLIYATSYLASLTYASSIVAILCGPAGFSVVNESGLMLTQYSQTISNALYMRVGYSIHETM